MPRAPGGRRDRSARGSAGPRGVCGAHFAFGAGAAVLVLVNEAGLALWPFWSPASRGPEEPPVHAAAEEVPGNDEHLAATPAPAASWQEVRSNPLDRLGRRGTLRLLPPPDEKFDAIAEQRRWLVFGLSSIRRPKIDYLGITLSQLFQNLDANDTAIVVHLADFNESWVSKTARMLGEDFTDEVAVGRLHTIHAPQRLYPLQQAALKSVTLSGFERSELNTRFRRSTEVLNGKDIYRSDTKEGYFIFWCQTAGAAVQHRRWVVAKKNNEHKVRAGKCDGVARAPEEHDVLDPLVLGWEEWQDKHWVANVVAGVGSIDVEAGELLKFEDTPQRQFWRTKQNLDYAFLMWYSTTFADYYMQLEDDIAIVPHFLPMVRSYARRFLFGRPWLLVSFSKLGFIGKFFNASRLQSLSEFLFILSGEAPCDWLVWDWIDALTNMPVTPDIVKDVEHEHNELQQAQEAGPEEVAKLPKMRDDLPLYWLKGEGDLFVSEARSPSVHKPPVAPNGEKVYSGPLGMVWSTMSTHEHYNPDNAFPPGDPLGFWTGDLCQGAKDVDDCLDREKGGKFYEIAFEEPVQLKGLAVRMGGDKHPNDYMRHGSLQVASERGERTKEKPQGCDSYVTVAEVSGKEASWSSKDLDEASCVRLKLDKPQMEWVHLLEFRVDTADAEAAHSDELLSDGSGGAAESGNALPRAVLVPAGADPDGERPALVSAALAAFAGAFAGVVGWFAVYVGRRVFPGGVQMVGDFACWALTYAIVLDVLFLSLMSPPSTDGPGSIAGGIQPAPQPHGVDWRGLRAGIHTVSLDRLRSQGSAEAAHGAARPTKAWLAIGMVLSPTSATSPGDLARAAQRLAKDGEEDGAVVVALVARACEAHGACGGRAHFLADLWAALGGAGGLLDERRLHVLDPPRELYPPPPVRGDNLDVALLLEYAAPLAENFILVEPGCKVQTGFVAALRTFVDGLEDAPWLSVPLTKHGLERKLLRSRLLPRFAEVLVMFPEQTADSLFWTVIDIVGNETAPKAIFLPSDAETRRRPDVVMQCSRASALIQHLGDVSSLEGKVQRHHEDYFDSHPIPNTLFNNPTGVMLTDLQGTVEMLQSMYDGSKPQNEVTCGGHHAPSCPECPQGHGAGWCNADCMWSSGECSAVYKTDRVTELKAVDTGMFASSRRVAGYIELVLDEVQDVQMVSLRMGAQLLPPEKCEDKADCRKAQAANADFEHALDDAELQFGRGHRGKHCDAYEKVRDVAGREVFWRSPASRPARGVRCIRIALNRPQQRPLVVRMFQVRSLPASAPQAAAMRAAEATAAAASPLRPRGALGLRGRVPLPLGRSSSAQAQGLQPSLEHEFSWIMLVSVAFISGAFGGAFGWLAYARHRSGRRIAPHDAVQGRRRAA